MHHRVVSNGTRHTTSLAAAADSVFGSRPTFHVVNSAKPATFYDVARLCSAVGQSLNLFSIVISFCVHQKSSRNEDSRHTGKLKELISLHNVEKMLLSV